MEDRSYRREGISTHINTLNALKPILTSIILISEHVPKWKDEKDISDERKEMRHVPSLRPGVCSSLAGTNPYVCKYDSWKLFLVLHRRISANRRNIVFDTVLYTGCSIRVDTLGNFEGKSSLPRQNWGTPEKLPRDHSILSRHNLGTLDKFSRQFSGTLEKLPRQNSGLCYTLCTSVTSWALRKKKFLYVQGNYKIDKRCP